LDPILFALSQLLTFDSQPAFLSFALTSLLATPLIAVLLVLFGAPLTTHNAETILCAAHMALLSATGLVYVHGVEASVWKEVWGIARPADAVWGSALGTGLGAWFGAIPIPLDW
jgi:phosphatidylinositol glycan class F